MSYVRRAKRFKVVVRNLPPDMDEEKFQNNFLAPMGALAQDAKFMYYVGGKNRKNDTPLGSRAYLMFSKSAAAKNFVAALQPPAAQQAYRNLPAETLEALGDQSQLPRIEQCTATISVYQSISMNVPRREAQIQNTVEKDEDYLRFLDCLEQEAEKKMPSAEKQLEDQLKTQDANARNEPPRSNAALVRFLVQKKAARIDKTRKKSTPQRVVRTKNSKQSSKRGSTKNSRQSGGRKNASNSKASESGPKRRTNEASRGKPKRIQRRDKDSSRGGAKKGGGGGGGGRKRGSRGGRDRGGGRAATIAPTMILSRALQSRGSGANAGGSAPKPMRILRKPKDTKTKRGNGKGGGGGKTYVNFLE